MSAANRAPAGLSAAGKSLWRRSLADVTQGWELDSKDLTLLEAACRAADRVADLEALIEGDGLMVVGSKGQAVLHPAIAEARLQRHLMAVLLGKVQLEPPEARTGHMSRRQRNQLRDARRARWSKPLASVPDVAHG